MIGIHGHFLRVLTGVSGADTDPLPQGSCSSQNRRKMRK
jgi:hypothetical protein